MLGQEYQWLIVCSIQTFKIRAAEIADHAHNPRGALGEGAEFLRGLDEMERQRETPPGMPSNSRSYRCLPSLPGRS